MSSKPHSNSPYRLTQRTRVRGTGAVIYGHSPRRVFNLRAGRVARGFVRLHPLYPRLTFFCTAPTIDQHGRRIIRKLRTAG